MPIFEKNFYIEHPAVTARSEYDTDQWRKKHNITVIGSGIPKPCLTFDEASMPGTSSSLVQPIFCNVIQNDSEYVLREVMKQGFAARKLCINM